MSTATLVPETYELEGDDALERAVETLERINGLGIRTVYPGHGPIITNPQPVIDRLLRKLDRYMKRPSLMHVDHLKKMVAYIVMTKGGMREEGMFEYLMGTVWYPQLVDRYFDAAYRDVYQMMIDEVLRSRMVVRDNGYFQGVGDK